jgi:Na+-transporting NADH:ubiquinone oxidoreductase subunit A
MDIYPDYLIRSILAEDIPEMEALGLYEVVEEDLALCAYVDPSKNDINAIVRQGLDLLEREG